MKKIVSIMLVFAMMLSFAACGSEPAAEGAYKVGICQLVQHEALDAATEGFKAALTEKLGEEVAFIEHNASGDAATCITICNQLVSENVDLIMGNATAALQAAAAATSEIPVVGTSITDYATALEIGDWTGTTGSNITGTADLAPLDQQAAMLAELFPEKITSVLKTGLAALDRKLHGFADPQGVLTAPETRSSSPVRILRDESRQSQLRGLYPTGEGAGYAGGIMSAALDGMMTAERIIEEVRRESHG